MYLKTDFDIDIDLDKKILALSGNQLLRITEIYFHAYAFALFKNLS